ncbi:hypothetical protein T261_4246 [Streptomyces lydicus]|nr:hypothetical protein T261_4246 [Streptomyces lydicus]
MSVKHRHVPDQDGYVRVAACTGLIVGPRALCGGRSGVWRGGRAFPLHTEGFARLNGVPRNRIAQAFTRSS